MTIEFKSYRISQNCIFIEFKYERVSALNGNGCVKPYQLLWWKENDQRYLEEEECIALDNIIKAKYYRI